MAEERKRELALPPGMYAYILDNTKGLVKLHVGPVNLNQTGQDLPVRFNSKTFKFEGCTLEEAAQQSAVVPEGFYASLTNPAKAKDGKIIYPETGRSQDTPDLAIGLKENIPGPVNFALYPGQTCEIRRGHHLRSNEYLLIKIYNEEKARENWSKAVLKPIDQTVTKTDGAATGANTTPLNPAAVPPKAETTPPKVEAASAAKPFVTRQAPADLSVGKQYNILGTEVSFYMPPTGVSVVAEGDDENGKAVFVRAAETLEQIEYSILVDEDGNKQYPKGPSVVFPRPTQRFLTDSKSNRKFRAIEMNALQGIQLKFITNGKLNFADGTSVNYKAGDEMFITGAQMPIYYPEEGHQLVKYDGKTIHYAVAIPEGEARYVMNRKTGEIRTVQGPTMLLPNPVDEIVVRRALSDYESATWFPGPNGTGSIDALEYNRWLRNEASKEPTTRQGVVSEGRVENQGGAAAGAAATFLGNSGAAGFDQLDAVAMNYAAPSSERGGGVARRSSAKSAMMQESRQGKQQEAMIGDTAERKSTFNEPRTLTFASKYKGVPMIKLQPGYAVNVVDTDGTREAVIGPKTLLLEFGQGLDTLALSTGKPKNTDKLFRTAYLNVHNNKVSDVVEVETADLVRVQLKLIYNVNFDGEPSKWFTIENYVKHLCDHVRSILKGKIRKIRIEEFYANSTDILRDSILGTAADGGKRIGLSFPENGMKVNDVEVLAANIADASIGQMLAQAQTQVIQQNIGLAQAKSKLEAIKQQEQIFREEAEAKFTTSKRKIELSKHEVTEQLGFELTKLGAVVEQHAATLKAKSAEQSIADLMHESTLAREKETQAAAEEVAVAMQARELTEIKAKTDAIVAQMAAINPQLAAALESVSARETLVKVAKELGFHQIFGGENAADFIGKAFAGTPLQGLIDKALTNGGMQHVNGSGATASPSRS